MAASAEGLIGLITVAAGIAAIHGWFSGKAKEREDNEHNRKLRERLREEKRHAEETAATVRKQLQEERAQLEREVAETEADLEGRWEMLSTMRENFEGGYVAGRKWLAHYISEADQAYDDLISASLRHKKHPALKAAEEVAAALAEKRRVKEQLKFLEYQLKSYKEYFPFLEDYEDIILDEAIPLAQNDQNIQDIKNADPVLHYVPKAEYHKLSDTERNQLALDRYLKRFHSQAEIGRFYERYLGWFLAIVCG